MKEVMKFFGFPNAAAFAKEWKKLTDKDKEDLKQGLADGSLTY